MNPIFKIFSYNVGGNSQLAGLKVLLDSYQPDIILIQEVTIDNVKLNALLGRDYRGESNIDVNNTRKPGTAVVWRSNLQVIVTNVVNCRVQTARLGDLHFVNVYAPSGTQGTRARKTMFGVDLLNIVASSKVKPILAGDWNCVIRPQDVEHLEDQEDRLLNRRSQFSQKKSVELQQLIRNFQYEDTFVRLHRVVDFTWARPGKRRSRLDRVYLPRGMVDSLVSVGHTLHLSDHKLVKVELDVDVTRQEESQSSAGYWKLNSRVLEDRDYIANFSVVWDEVMASKERYVDVAVWFDEVFKTRFKGFLVSYSKYRAKGRRDMINYLSFCLQEAGNEGNWQEISYS